MKASNIFSGVPLGMSGVAQETEGVLAHCEELAKEVNGEWRDGTLSCTIGSWFAWWLAHTPIDPDTCRVRELHSVDVLYIGEDKADDAAFKAALDKTKGRWVEYHESTLSELLQCNEDVEFEIGENGECPNLASGFGRVWYNHNVDGVVGFAHNVEAVEKYYACCEAVYAPTQQPTAEDTRNDTDLPF